MAEHPLLHTYAEVADGRFPVADGGVTLLPALAGGLECSVAFTGHAMIATALPADVVAGHRPDGFGASLAPEFLRRLAGADGWIGAVDVTLAGRGTGGRARLGVRSDADDHPRVRRARSLRTEVGVYGDERGVVALGAGIAGRREISIELDPPYLDRRGTGRALLRDALTLVPEGETVFAAVAPGNARSLRAFLSAGFTPIGSEVLIRPRRLPG